MYALKENCEVVNIEQIYTELSEHIANTGSAELDCAHVEYVDSSFLQLILSLKHSNVPIVLKNRSSAINEILTLYHIDLEGE